MQFAFTDEQAMIAETARAFFAEHATSERVRAAMAETSGFDRSLWSGLTTELGLAGAAIPEAFGGVGLGQVEFAILAEAAGAHVAAVPHLSSLGLAAQGILAGGSDAQKERWLPALVGGSAVAAAALDAGHLGPRFEGGRLVGRAALVSHGAAADLFVIMTSDAGVIVEAGTPGVSVTPLTTMDQTRPLARIDFNNVAGEPLPDPIAARRAALHSGWIAIAADALGGAQAALDRTAAYCMERVQFGRPIGSFQAIKHRLADMMVEVEQARSAVFWAACATDESSPDAELAAHSAKAFACDAYSMCASNMIQLHGGIGFTWEHDAHLFFKRARANASLLGSPDWHRERVARLMGLDTDVLELA